MGEPIIHIIPDFKELSKKSENETTKKCGMMGLTNENCIADYINGKLVKRNNYNRMVDENDKLPNRFLGNNFKIENIPLNIGDYNNNWVKLFTSINGIVGENVTEKVNVFITSHQHNLQNMFFKFNSSPDPTKPYGFRNCTCIKISKDDIPMKVIHSENTGRDKSKYTYLEKEQDLQEVLGFIPNLNVPVLDKCDIYIIRHGEAMHNLIDVKNELYKKKAINAESITEGNIEMLKIMGDSETKGASWNISKLGKAIVGVNQPKLNALLTTQGIQQANSLYENTLQGIIKGKKNIYISSPMDRTIATLIYATSPHGNGFPKLKEQFAQMYEERFPKTHNEVILPDRETNDIMLKNNDKSMSHNFQLSNRNSLVQQQQPQNRDSLRQQEQIRFSQKERIRGQGGKRKSKRNMKHKSKKNKRSKKAKKTRKQTRRTRKRYQRGCSRK